MRTALTVPELPEVETLRRGLAARISGMTITAVSILDRKISGGPGDAIQQDIDGHQISRVVRRGKVLILFLREPGETRQESGSLLIHPKMTGQLVLTANSATVFAGGHPTPSMLRPMPNATTRAVFRLGPACCLYYNDARRFGWIRLGYLGQAHVFRRQGLPCQVCGTLVIRTLAGRATNFCPYCQRR